MASILSRGRWVKKFYELTLSPETFTQASINWSMRFLLYRSAASVLPSGIVRNKFHRWCEIAIYLYSVPELMGLVLENASPLNLLLISRIIQKKSSMVRSTWLNWWPVLQKKWRGEFNFMPTLGGTWHFLEDTRSWDPGSGQGTASNSH